MSVRVHDREIVSGAVMDLREKVCAMEALLSCYELRIAVQGALLERILVCLNAAMDEDNCCSLAVTVEAIVREISLSSLEHGTGGCC